MTAKRVFVTGATGFIGQKLVERLVSRGDHVTCLVRKTSAVSPFIEQHCRLVVGDVLDEKCLSFQRESDYELLFHLAACTQAANSRDLMQINPRGTRNVLNHFASNDRPPVAVCISSLAAVGPSSRMRPHDESSPCKPVSFYGRSKAESEREAAKFSHRLPISIVRPPIVLGGGDRRGLIMFRLIELLNRHLVPGFADRVYSVIHVDDLVSALIAVAEQGTRLDQKNDEAQSGVYFAASDESFSYVDLGQLIGEALGHSNTQSFRIPKFCLLVFAAMNEVLSYLTGKPRYLKLDKFREVFAGSWHCSNEKIKRDTGFAPAASVRERLQQTAQWYRRHNWLPQSEPRTSYRPAQSTARIHGR